MTAKSMLLVPDAIKQVLTGEDVFDGVMGLQGKAFRDVKGRRTIQVSLNGRSYFVKQHFGVGWREILKNLFSFKKPVLGAMTEVEAIKKLALIGISTTPLIGYGVKGINPATQQSFLITEDLGDIVSLEDLCANWKQNPPDPALKVGIITALAQLAAKLHGAGMCHRDFYLCHFVMRASELAEGKVNLILIDLHRMLLGQSSHGNAVMKDIAGLVFSAMDCGFTEEDWLLFRRHYLPQSGAFWLEVEARAQKLYAKFNSARFQNRLAKEKSLIQQ
ncbi:MAG: lipopolysaccharide core heptose(I) kinase RfaP [Betaproteobacteria bacterium]|nr:lipopolysaccharide core heptose(I) kinase RfaP [Betaproteobacteria bacterium]